MYSECKKAYQDIYTKVRDKSGQAGFKDWKCFWMDDKA